MQREALLVELERFDLQREPTEKVSGVAVNELLGAGALDFVWRVRRGRNGPFYALKVCAECAPRRTIPASCFIALVGVACIPPMIFAESNRTPSKKYGRPV